MTDYRLFIAIELPPPVSQALNSLQDRLQAARPVRWVKPAQIHLTLQFLGETPAAKIDPLVAALTETIPLAGRPFSLTLGGVGAFPNLKRPRVIWVGLADQAKQLPKLYAAVIRATQGLGFTPEERPFSPHLTLGRTEKQAAGRDYAQIGQVIQEQQGQIGPSASFMVDHISLIRSQLQPAGPIYTTLAEIELR